ncbi:serine/threonine-protein kinase [Melioribacter sp. OK-6-Me]|uniref:serine/threonine-protein kinase n=1 Tax=unclassified Melioribacter TaxID=2627329 RepID=UPI003EDA36CB
MSGKSEIMFEKFEILEVLKKDEHAGVYLANHIYLSKKIILKVLNTAKISDPSLLERFKREAKLLARLDHPNIIKVLDFGTSKEFFYISFEYIEGTSLRNILQESTLSKDDKKKLTIQLFKALNFAHKNRIIHRDIKPENIFVDKNLNLKLGDFGLALSADDNFVTSPYSIVGTPSYMSPEQVSGSQLTHKSDLFSAGVVIYELFTGKNPFLRENVTLTLNEIMSFNENSIKENLEGLDDDIKDILTGLLKKKPAARIDSAEDVLEKLNAKEEGGDLDKLENKVKKKYGIIIPLFVLLILVIAITIIVKDDKHSEINLPSNEVDTEFTAPSKTNNKTGNIVSEEKPTLIDDQNLTNKTDELNIPAEVQKQASIEDVGEGGLFVECFPWADVYIDGEKIETTPLKKPLTLSAGEHTLKLVHPDYPIYSEILKIEKNKLTNLKISLESLLGFLDIKVNPWGNIYINGNYKGQTPLKEYIRVNPGFMRLKITNPNFKDVDTTVYVGQGDSLKLKFNLATK